MEKQGSLSFTGVFGVRAVLRNTCFRLAACHTCHVVLMEKADSGRGMLTESASFSQFLGRHMVEQAKFRVLGQSSSLLRRKGDNNSYYDIG